MKHFFTTPLLSFLMLASMVSITACSDDAEKEKVNQEMELKIAGDWMATSFIFDYGKPSSEEYEVCSDESEALYADEKYASGLHAVSIHLSLNGDKTAVVSPLCSGEQEESYTSWTVVDKSGGMYLKLMKEGKTVEYVIQSWSVSNIKLHPVGFGLDETFVGVLELDN